MRGIGLHHQKGWARLLDFAAGLLLLGAGQGLFLAILLLIRPALRTPANLFLAALIAGLSLTLLDDLALQSGYYGRHAGATGWLLLFAPLLAPALRLHVEALITQDDWHWQRRHWRLAIIPLIYAICLVPLLILPSHMRWAILADRPEVGLPEAVAVYGWLVAFILTAAQQGHAIFVSWRSVATFGSNTDPASATRMVWLRGLLLLCFACWLGYVLSLITGLFLPALAMPVQLAASAVMVAALYGLGLLGLARPDSLLPPPGELVERLIEPARAKYARSALDGDDIARIAAKLHQLMERDRPYTDPMLNLPRLAALIGASVNDVSQAINSAFGLNYYEYINRHRVKAACALLGDLACTATVLDIALEVGFNSKSVFNAAFKRETGRTPSEYRARPNV